MSDYPDHGGYSMFPQYGVPTLVTGIVTCPDNAYTALVDITGKGVLINFRANSYGVGAMINDGIRVTLDGTYQWINYFFEMIDQGLIAPGSSMLYLTCYDSPGKEFVVCLGFQVPFSSSIKIEYFAALGGGGPRTVMRECTYYNLV